MTSKDGALSLQTTVSFQGRAAVVPQAFYEVEVTRTASLGEECFVVHVSQTLHSLETLVPVGVLSLDHHSKIVLSESTTCSACGTQVLIHTSALKSSPRYRKYHLQLSKNDDMTNR